MNYRHVYHAGNFADVLKHVALIALLNAYARKNTPYCYIDTHAGIGYYDLACEQAKKSSEFINGIEKIIQQDDPPALIQQYLDCVHAINNKLSQAGYAPLQYYPGSPMIARHLARPHDRIVACELHPEDYQTLKNVFNGDKQVAVHHTDGFLGLKAFLPPKEKRGVILIDPPYEDPDEFTRIAHAMHPAIKRFETGTFAIWYPIKEKIQVERFYRTLKQQIQKEIFIIELTLYPDLPKHLNGCGLAVINPPWQFDQSINNTLPWLWKTLSINGQGGFRTFLAK